MINKTFFSRGILDKIELRLSNEIKLRVRNCLSMIAGPWALIYIILVIHTQTANYAICN